MLKLCPADEEGGTWCSTKALGAALYQYFKEACSQAPATSAKVRCRSHMCECLLCLRAMLLSVCCLCAAQPLDRSGVLVCIALATIPVANDI